MCEHFLWRSREWYCRFFFFLFSVTEFQIVYPRWSLWTDAWKMTGIIFSFVVDLSKKLSIEKSSHSFVYSPWNIDSYDYLFIATHHRGHYYIHHWIQQPTPYVPTPFLIILVPRWISEIFTTLKQKSMNRIFKTRNLTMIFKSNKITILHI